MTECICDLERPGNYSQKAKALLPVATAQATLSEIARIRVGREQRRLEDCQGRILATDLHAVQTVPPHDNSAMDGYGVSLADLPEHRTLAVSQRVPAGTVPLPLVEGTAVRIFTGAPIPAGVDAVIPQEQVTVLGDQHIQLHITPVRGQNIRRAGEDIHIGEALLEAGTRLEAAEIGLLASQGIEAVEVYAQLRVAVLTTGNELVAPGQALAPGQIYNSNAFTLRAALERLGCRVTQVDVVEDSFDATRDGLARAAADHDLVITTGGVSVGDEDHVRPAVQALGSLKIWGIAMKPGKPFAFGQIGETPFLGLPGNPMAALVTFEVLASDYIRRLMGARVQPVIPTPIPAGFNQTRTNPRQEYLRVVLDMRSGEPRAVLAGSQSSGVLSVASRADGYLIIPPHQTIMEGALYGFVHRDQFYR
ncbi:molybdopterin molybdotransferase MoeA [Marinobacter nanhaiticus D15-8W]|uniref:Molybdopterin molybdenumtransferase n=1 Tax=Marinobacter nanhaiticus D15-8W TaxID=626887 RepID=N6WZ11_9GAMM|nr:gephyrin-like molybdotransferase Glp [Marinobacter nanhaiticus]ENO16367.1 molybdopterin molybdenumtransferase MoeA [Marinobacter nanhaiticus D15-8W]BES72772.1 molybdopterin molybdotransferase MoeA [Marinobacter nanhaiticus D15-8W]